MKMAARVPAPMMLVHVGLGASEATILGGKASFVQPLSWPPRWLEKARLHSGIGLVWSYQLNSVLHRNVSEYRKKIYLAHFIEQPNF